MQCSKRRDRRDGIYWPRDTAGKMVPAVAAHARGRRAQGHRSGNFSPRRRRGKRREYDDKMKTEGIKLVRCEGHATVWYRSLGGEERIGLA